MIILPLECYYIIFNNLQYNYKNLYSCALVNRQWCRIIIPILWRDPKNHFKNLKLIKIFLLTLNVKEQSLLIPFKITLPNHPKPLFEYTNYITSVNNDLYDGVRNWLYYKRYKPTEYILENNLENAVKCSLISMFLRTGKNLKYLSLNEIICNQIIFENLYENTTVTSIHLDNICGDFKYKTLDVLVKILQKNSTLTSLNLEFYLLDFEGVKTLLEALYKNTVLNSLNLCKNQISNKEVEALAKFLYGNTTLTNLDLANNYIRSEGGIALADALYKNTTLTYLGLAEGGEALANALCKNTTITSLDLEYNELELEGGKALADALCKNITLTSLNLASNNLGKEEKH
ncbi:RNI-like protein [Gigaspora margarita]|uniref:RNI-like protein n=1 Tax=Gigaspora margarita TaxID=4874 RepID=A0A8H4EHY2_GIGMA|nr:RNI-like protein [Gigaspora margarita]